MVLVASKSIISAKGVRLSGNLFVFIILVDSYITVFLHDYGTFLTCSIWGGVKVILRSL